MRKPDERRKEQRKDAKTRKEEEKLKRKEEINKLKAWKREEIIEKLKKTEFIAGNFGHKNRSELGVAGGILSDKKLLERAEKELNTEFIPDLYDQTMSKLFNQQYYDASDAEGDNLENQKDIDNQLLNDNAKLTQIGVDQGDSEEISDLENQGELNEQTEQDFI